VARRVEQSDREGWTITERGRLDLECAATCQCNPRLVGLLIECPNCGTVYGSLKEGLNSTQTYRGKKD